MFSLYVILHVIKKEKESYMFSCFIMSLSLLYIPYRKRTVRKQLSFLKKKGTAQGYIKGLYCLLNSRRWVICYMVNITWACLLIYSVYLFLFFSFLFFKWERQGKKKKLVFLFLFFLFFPIFSSPLRRDKKIDKEIERQIKTSFVWFLNVILFVFVFVCDLLTAGI